MNCEEIFIFCYLDSDFHNDIFFYILRYLLEFYLKKKIVQVLLLLNLILNNFHGLLFDELILRMMKCFRQSGGVWDWLGLMVDPWIHEVALADLLVMEFIMRKNRWANQKFNQIRPGGKFHFQCVCRKVASRISKFNWFSRIFYWILNNNYSEVFESHL